MCSLTTDPIWANQSGLKSSDHRPLSIARMSPIGRTVWSDTGAPCLPNVFRAVSVAGAKGSRTWCRKIIRSWRGVVTRGLPLLGVSRTWPWVLKRTQRRQMVEVATPIAAATRAGRCPTCNRPMTLSLSLVLSLGMVVSRKGLFSQGVRTSAFIRIGV